MSPSTLTAVIGGKRYSTETATLIANDAYWDGHNWERRGRNTFLYRTPNGSYFKQFRSQWQGDRSAWLEACTEDEAVQFWEECKCDRIEFEEAFPGREVIDA